ncbi:multidrug efflux pump subunit AcrA (membrane-fusion protein) [Pedobacter sp. UYP30]|uniref:efflux RND transporter periplasmic adaptor subunit n=1 Tax=Pedobacter sp. UYP30 TaxID=1756400 RepID=UPI003392DF6D
MRRYKQLLYTTFGLVLIFSCKQQDATTADEGSVATTPVKVTTVKDSTLTETISLTAVSAYLQKSLIKANINGYIQKANATPGKSIYAGQVLFRIITKEAKAIGNVVNKLDPSFKFSGISNIKAAQSGMIVQVDRQKGDYVQDGDLLATVISKNSLVFLLDLPFEYNKIIQQNKKIQVLLPDGEKLNGVLSGSLPAVDSLAQTQRLIIKVANATNIPEGLVAKVVLVKTNHPNAQVLPKSAVLSNETEDEFWVMKLTNDSTAVKVGIKRGLENNGLIEIDSPKFKQNDKIITLGNYGLADTAKVKIQK